MAGISILITSECVRGSARGDVELTRHRVDRYWYAGQAFVV